MKCNGLRFSLALSLIPALATAQVETDFLYRPYPVILVHGFNAMADSWGVTTHKGIKSELKYSTNITGFANASVGNTLASAFSPTGNVESGNAMAFPDYYRSGLTPTLTDLRPLEEPGSFDGLDHTYVEVYGVYYYNESDDDNGTRSGHSPPKAPIRFLAGSSGSLPRPLLQAPISRVVVKPRCSGPGSSRS